MPDWFALGVAAFVGFGLGVGLTYGALAVRILRDITGDDKE
jgi:hypothetical protein